MRILFLSPGAGLGGAERALLEMVASLREEYPRCEIQVIIGDSGPLAERLDRLGVSLTIAHLPPGLAAIGDAGAGGPAGMQLSPAGLILRMTRAAPLVAAYVRQLNKAIKRIRPDVVHSNGFKMHLLGAWATPRALPLVWHLHDFVGLRPVMSRLLRFNIHFCDGIIANSRSVSNDARTVFDCGISIETVYNGVDLSEFAPEGSRLDLDTLAGMAPSPLNVVRIGLVATMARWKGHEVFLRALAMLPLEHVRAYVIGGPIYRTAGSQYSLGELRRTTFALGLNERVGFTGFIDDTASAMRALDIIAHTSVAPEPFGLAVAEAFACSRAVVASRSGGVLEIIRENENALMHTPGDAHELAATLARLVDDRTLRLQLGAAARRTAESLFPRARLANDLMSVYRRVITGNVSSWFDTRPLN